MKQRLNSMSNRAVKKKSWSWKCLYIAIGLLILSGVLYLIHYIGIDREFYMDHEFFGNKVYGELFALDQKQEEFTALTQQAQEALAFVGTREEAEERFGLLSHYCTTAEGATQSRWTMKVISAGAKGNRGYVWVAYTRDLLSPEGEVLQSHGSEKYRALSRWAVEKQDGQWVITEIRENDR
ncbi:MAG: hypothetical protein IKT58_02230 [Oscillospiraceae bacterium]|nr:hypothetical protein [Oscillospiraceae bacterium]